MKRNLAKNYNKAYRLADTRTDYLENKSFDSVNSTIDDKKGRQIKNRKHQDAYYSEIYRHSLLSRAEEKEYSKRMNTTKQRILYFLCNIPKYTGNIEDDIKQNFLDVTNMSIDNHIIIGKDRITVSSKKKCGECIATIGLINNTIDLLYSRLSTLYKSKDIGSIQKEIARGQNHKFGLLKAFNLTQTCLIKQINNLVQNKESIFQEYASRMRFDKTESKIQFNALTKQISFLQELAHECETYFNRFANSNLRLVINLAKRYVRPNTNLDDLIQDGNIGLIKAIERYDLKKECRFSTFATWWIKQSILNGIANNSRTIRIPVHMHAYINSVKYAIAKFACVRQTIPAPEEIADITGIELNWVNKALEIIGHVPISLDMQFRSSDEDSGSFKDVIKDDSAVSPARNSEQIGLDKKVDELLDNLPERSKQIIKMRYGIGMERTYILDECGSLFNLSHERVRQIEKEAIRVLRIKGQNNK